MRLIDADALENDIRRVLKKSYMFSTRNFLALHMMIDIIRDRDTIRAEPVKHGKWNLSNSYKDENSDLVNMYSCSCCNIILDKATDYCPNCGAKMDGGAEK